MADKQDMYPNVLTRRIVMSAANTLTFSALDVGLNIFDKAALVVERLVIDFAQAVPLLVGTGDQIIGGLVTSDTLVDMRLEQIEVVARSQIVRHDMGAAATAAVKSFQHTLDFATMGGGGLLLAPKPLYFAATSASVAAAATVDFQLFFRVLRLTDTQYLELLETRRTFG